MCRPEIQDIRGDMASAGQPRGAGVVEGREGVRPLLPPPQPPVSPALPIADPVGSR